MMRQLNIIAVLIGALLALAIAPRPGWAGETTASLAQELVSVMGMTMTVSGFQVTVSEDLTGPVDPALPDPDQRATALAQALLADELAPLFDETGTMVETVLAGNFTADELTVLLAFYRSETGRKTITVIPAIWEAMAEGFQRRLPAIGQSILTRVLEQMRAEGYPLP